MPPVYCYILISPDPRVMTPMTPRAGQQLATRPQGTNFHPPAGGNYYIKIGDQDNTMTRNAGYTTQNPSFYWCDIELLNYTPPATAPTQRVGKTLENLLIGNAALNPPFKQAPGALEWYYDFNNAQNLTNLITYLEGRKGTPLHAPVNKPRVTFLDPATMNVFIGQYFHTA